VELTALDDTFAVNAHNYMEQRLLKK